jgi:hypothetical protein
LKTFGRREILRFVRSMDESLKKKATLWIVGGAAAAIQYGAQKKTGDIDFIYAKGDASDIGRASESAAAKTGFPIAVSGAAAGVTVMPDGFEGRLVDARGLKLSKLSLKVPDKYDLVLSKIAADRPHDLEVVMEIHKRHKLSRSTLVERFESEVLNVSASGPRRLASAFVSAVSQLFGDAAASELEGRYAALNLR